MYRTAARLLFALLFAAAGVQGRTVTVSMPANGNASFPIRISNPGAAPASPLFIMDQQGYGTGFELSTAPPCTLELHFNEDHWLRVANAPLAPGASVDCTVTVTRDQRDPDQNVSWTPQPDSTPQGAVLSPALWRVGAYADLRFELLQTPPYPSAGGRSAIFRFGLRNTAAFPITGAEVYTCDTNLYTMDADLPGGCASASSQVQLDCPLSLPEFHWILPPVGADGEASCLIRFTAREGQAFDQLGFLGIHAGTSDDGFLVQDTSSGDAIATGVLSADSVIPLSSRGALIALAVLFMLSGAALLASSRSVLRR